MNEEIDNATLQKATNVVTMLNSYFSERINC